ncbi:MAG: phage distal tail protein, Rcc01695 family [Alphaproteobacteria bacterium]
MSFHEIRFPTAISFGSTGGVERRTEVISLVNGFEQRNTPWEQSRRRYDAGLGVQSLDDLEAVLSFFEARRGMLIGFRWKDWLDHKSCAPSAVPDPLDQAIGIGDGTTTAFMLTKTYAPGAYEFRREIAKPVAGSVRVAVDGVEVTEGPGFSVDTATGIVTFAAAPAAGFAVTAGFEFDVPVRFDTDVIEVNVAAFEAGEIPPIPAVEVRI